MKKKQQSNEPGITLETTVLQEAQGLIYGDRQKAYGSASENFRNTAQGWTTLLSRKLTSPITEEEVGWMMVWLKMARQIHKPQRDNLVDACGYLGCIEKVQKGE